MPQAALVPLTLEAYLAFFAVLAILIAGVLWFQQRKQIQERERFFRGFDLSQLRMSPYKIGLVYHLIKTEENQVTVIPIWDGTSKVVRGQELNVPADELMPFDERRFV